MDGEQPGDGSAEQPESDEGLQRREELEPVGRRGHVAVAERGERHEREGDGEQRGGVAGVLWRNREAAGDVREIEQREPGDEQDGPHHDDEGEREWAADRDGAPTGRA
jgi:hypothetical protein